MKPTVLVLLSRYLPGVKAGGPIRSISNLIEVLGDEIHFRVVTTDRDKDDAVHYENIEPNHWTKVGKAQVLYLSPDRLGIHSFYGILKSEKADFLYLNSFFAPQFSLLPVLLREFGARGQRAVLLAPRGEFSPGALQLHHRRKAVWLSFARRLRTYKHLLWHASSSHEVRDIQREFGTDVSIKVALPLSQPACDRRPTISPDKMPGKLRAVFVSRIVPKKNLLQAIQMLNGISGEIEFNIYGPAEDAAYWQKCQGQIAALPDNIRVEFRSLVEHSAVPGIFADHHLFLFPTLGENYGHVIFEALNSGCPVLISDQTPWRDLEASGAGWDLPLDQLDLFRAAIRRCVSMTAEEFRMASVSARSFASRFTSESDLLASNRKLFAAELL